MLPDRQELPGLCLVPKWRNWQTRVVQVHVLARVWGFESLLRHQQNIHLIESQCKYIKLSSLLDLTSVIFVTGIHRYTPDSSQKP